MISNLFVANRKRKVEFCFVIRWENGVNLANELFFFVYLSAVVRGLVNWRGLCRIFHISGIGASLLSLHHFELDAFSLNVFAIDFCYWRLFYKRYTNFVHSLRCWVLHQFCIPVRYYWTLFKKKEGNMEEKTTYEKERESEKNLNNFFWVSLLGTKVHIQKYKKKTSDKCEFKDKITLFVDVLTKTSIFVVGHRSTLISHDFITIYNLLTKFMEKA